MARGWGQDRAFCEAPGFTGHEQSVHSCCHSWRICQKLARSLKDRWGLECDSVCAHTQTHTHTHTHTQTSRVVCSHARGRGTRYCIFLRIKRNLGSDSRVLHFASDGSRRAEFPWPWRWSSQLSGRRQQLPRPMSPPSLTPRVSS